MNISMHTSNTAGLNPIGFGIQQRYLGMSTGGINVNPNTNTNSLMGTQMNTGMKINNTGDTSISRSAPAQSAPAQSAPAQSAPAQSTFTTDKSILNVKPKPEDLVSNSAPLDQFLDEHALTIKYKKGDEIVTRLKKNFKAAKLHKKVKFRSDKKLKWSPQYYLDGEVTNLRGYMNNELLHINLIEQLEEWKESSESSGFDDKTDSEADSEEEAEANDSNNEEEVEANDSNNEEEVEANDSNNEEEVEANDSNNEEEVEANDSNNEEEVEANDSNDEAENSADE